MLQAAVYANNEPLVITGWHYEKGYGNSVITSTLLTQEVFPQGSHREVLSVRLTISLSYGKTYLSVSVTRRKLAVSYSCNTMNATNDEIALTPNGC